MLTATPSQSDGQNVVHVVKNLIAWNFAGPSLFRHLAHLFIGDTHRAYQKIDYCAPEIIWLTGTSSLGIFRVYENQLMNV
jgi:hypothetical protein